MSKPLTSRTLVSGAQFPAGWMLKSGQPGESRGPLATVRDGIQFFVSGPDGRVVYLDLDVHDAGDLYVALEAHMENVAAPPTPEGEEFKRDHMTPVAEVSELAREDFRKASLEAIQEQIDNPLEVNGGPRADDLSDEFEAVAAVVEEYAKVRRFGQAEIVRRYPALAAALNKLAALNA